VPSELAVWCASRESEGHVISSKVTGVDAVAYHDQLYCITRRTCTHHLRCEAIDLCDCLTHRPMLTDRCCLADIVRSPKAVRY
jgi:hypothetical protein